MKAEDRDFSKHPYSADEARVAKFLSGLGAGGGDDPVGFVIASHQVLAAERNAHKQALERIAAIDPSSPASKAAKDYLAEA